MTPDDRTLDDGALEGEALEGDALEDRALLDLLQKDFPIAPRPFALLGAKAGLTEAEVVARVAAWRKSGIIRRLGPVFEPRRLGYSGVLCGAAVPEARIGRVAGVVNRFPGVTHNYLREARWPAGRMPAMAPGIRFFNLWFTLTAASSGDIAQTLDIAREEAGLAPEDLAVFPATRLFKIKVEFSLGDETGELATGQPVPGWGSDGEREPAEVGLAGATKAAADATRAAAGDLAGADWDLIEGLQDELPPINRPFGPLAARLGFSEDELCARVDELRQAGVIRRFGATLKHVAVGYGANAMVVWRVPAGATVEAGRAMAAFTAVSHCYERTEAAGWPFNLYTMIHGKSDDGVFATTQAIEQATGIRERLHLFTVRELKKERMRYRRPPE